MVGGDRVCRVSWHFQDEEHWCSTDRLVGLGPPDQNLEPWRSHEDVPPAVVPSVVNWETDGGTRFDCLSMAKTRKVRHTHRTGPRDLRLEEMEQRQWSSGWRMGRCRRNGLCLLGVASGGAWAENVSSEVLSRLLKLREGQVFCPCKLGLGGIS